MTNEVPGNNKHCGCCREFVHEWHRHPGGGHGDRRKNLPWFPMLPGVLVTRGGRCYSFEARHATGKAL